MVDVSEEKTLPIVSVCIPTYNGAEFLDDCLKSVRTQTMEQIEIVITDDNSTDETWQIVQRHADVDDRVKFYKNDTSRGLPGNWDAAIKQSTAPFVKLVFQDDLLDETCLEKMVAAMGTEFQFAVCRREFIYESADSGFAAYVAKWNMETVFGGCEIISAEDAAVKFAVLGERNFVGEPTAVMFTRKLYESLGPFDDSLTQVVDLEYWARAATAVGIRYLPETLAHFRIHTNSATSFNCDPERLFRTGLYNTLNLFGSYALKPEFTSLRRVARMRGVPIERVLALRVLNIQRETWWKDLLRRPRDRQSPVIRQYLADNIEVQRIVDTQMPFWERSLRKYIRKPRRMQKVSILWPKRLSVDDFKLLSKSEILQSLWLGAIANTA